MDTPRTPFGIDAMMNTTVDYFRKAWSSFNLPTQLAPTVDIAELDKRINNLKAVESWLNLNLTMLRTTIQGLEIQRGTVAAISTIGQAVDQTGSTFADWARQAQEARSNLVSETTANAMAAVTTPLAGARREREAAIAREQEARAARAAPPPAPEPEPEDEAASRVGSTDPVTSTARLGSAFFNMFAPRSTTARDTEADPEGQAEKEASEEPESADAPAMEAGSAQPAETRTPTEALTPDAPTQEAGPAEGETAGGGSATTALAEGLAAATAQFINPGAWWNMLQGQFNQIVQAAAPSARTDGDEAGTPPGKSRGSGTRKRATTATKGKTKAATGRQKAPSGAAPGGRGVRTAGPGARGGSAAKSVTTTATKATSKTTKKSAATTKKAAKTPARSRPAARTGAKTGTKA